MTSTFVKDKSQMIVIFLCLLLLVLRFIKFPDNILSWDVFGYYLYLPANFIYHDPFLQNTAWLDKLMSQYDPSATLYQLYPMAEGKMLIKYTSGTAILTLPFFLLAHFSASFLGFPADGLSLPYQLSMADGGLVYAFIGLFYFKKILDHFFEKNIALLVLLLVFFGTNYLQIIAFDGTLLAHNFLFTFYAILIYYTIRWHENQSANAAKMIALSFGFISLLRPTEAVSILIPLLYNVHDWKSFKLKIFLIKNNIPQLKMAVFILIVIWAPQLIYWKTTTGHYFFNSYQNAGEGLDFLSPHTLDFLFSFRKGWLVYTPVMAFSIIGFILLFLKNRSIFYATFIFSVVNIYVISSWTCWWYAGGSFSARAIVPAYIVLALPLGYFIAWMKQKGIVLKYVTSIIFLLLVALNLFQTWQFENGIISKQRMTLDYYFAIFGKTKAAPEAEKLLLIDRPEDGVYEFKDESDYKMKVLFSTITPIYHSTDTLFINNENEFSGSVDYQFNEHIENETVEVNARVRSNSEKENQTIYLVLTMQQDNQNYFYRAEKIILSREEWKEVSYEYDKPKLQNDGDVLKIYWWNKDEADDLEIADFKVDSKERFILKKEDLYSNSLKYTFQELTSTDHAWIRVKAKIQAKKLKNNQQFYLVASFHHNDVPYSYRAEEIELKNDEWFNIQFDYLTPEVRSKDDVLKTYFWNRDEIPYLVISDWVVEEFEKLN